MEQTKPLAFEVKLTAKELFRFSLYHTNRGMMGVFNVIFTAIVLFMLVYTWNSNSTVYRVLLILCALMFTVWQPAMLYFRAKKQAGTPMIRCPMTLSFCEAGIAVRQGDQSLDVTWDRVERVDRTRDMIILYTDKIHAYLVPVSAMAQGQERMLCGLLREQLPPEKRRRI